MSTPGDNIQPEESAAVQPAAATSSSSSGTTHDQTNPWSTTCTPLGPTGMPILSDPPDIRPLPGLEDQPVKYRLKTKTTHNGVAQHSCPSSQ
eukprot:4444284-Amphidinium_carterae.1